MKISIIGGGLAGCETAQYIANKGISVDLYEMKKIKKTPAQHSESFGELVCSNSLKSNSISNACGLLKEELRLLGSLCMEAATASRVPAGDALAVDRDIFATEVTKEMPVSRHVSCSTFSSRLLIEANRTHDS